MSTATKGHTVQIHYTGTLDDGTTFDSSEGGDPLEFELGGGQIIPGLERAIEGMAVGDAKQVAIAPEEAYGPRQEELVQNVPIAALPADLEPAVGMQLKSQAPDGQVMLMVVTEITDENITVDANHPLAGQALNFTIELVSIS